MEIPEAERDLPDMIMKQAVYTFGKPDRKPLILEAEEISIWQKDTKTVIKNISFHQNKKNSEEVELTGSCESGLSLNNSKVTLKGNVKLYKNTDNVKIECDELDWDDESQTIRTEGIVYMTYQDGTELKARGFKALLDENVYEFEEIISGRYTPDEQDEK